MTATQTLKLYEILHKHFKNDADAKVVVQEIEVLIDNKFEKEKNLLSTKEDISLLRQDFLKAQLEIEKRLNNIIIWIVASALASAGILLTIIKLFFDNK
jgi:hypothetical protein